MAEPKYPNDDTLRGARIARAIPRLNAVEPHTRLPFSIKLGEPSFWNLELFDQPGQRTLPFSPTRSYKMLLTTGLIALSRKVTDERAKKKEARQGHLNVGDSEVAKRAFASQIQRTGTEIKYEQPEEVTASSATTSPATPSSTAIPWDTHPTSQPSSKSPVRSEKAYPASPYSETTIPFRDDLSLHDSTTTEPPPYSPTPQSPISLPGSSVYSRDLDGNSLTTWDTKSSSTRSTNSGGTHAIRIKTIGSDLKSGFPYHPELFELRVHPEKWTAFTTQIVESTKFSMNDHAKIWAASAATAMTGAIGTSIYIGRSMNRSAQEKKVKEGLTDPSDGGLGETLRDWNENYFNDRGLSVTLELSESALKNPGQKSKALRKSALLYSTREDRERKRDERKFVIVVTRVDEPGQPIAALQERDVVEKHPIEIGSSDEPSQIVELPADFGLDPVELPAGLSPSSQKTVPAPSGYFELDNDNTLLLEKLHLEHGTGRPSMDSEEELMTEPSATKWTSAEALNT